jgi:hypothetical protein
VLGDVDVEYGNGYISVGGRTVDLALTSPYDDMLPDPG